MNRNTIYVMGLRWTAGFSAPARGSGRDTADTGKPAIELPRIFRRARACPGAGTPPPACIALRRRREARDAAPAPSGHKLSQASIRWEDGLIQPTREDFENNLRFRVTLRRFLRWSEDQATAAGLTPAQHQLLVAIKGHPGPEPPAIRDIAEYLQLQSHSAVGLVDRAEAAGVVRRQQDTRDARVVRLYLTGKGDRLVKNLTSAHLRELYNLSEALNNVLPIVRPQQMHPAE